MTTVTRRALLAAAIALGMAGPPAASACGLDGLEGDHGLDRAFGIPQHRRAAARAAPLS